MILQNFRSDFTIVKNFSREIDGEIQTILVPDHLELVYFVDGFKSCYKASRKGDECINCSISEDGMSLSVYLKLSEACLGPGRLLEMMTEYIEDDTFPGGFRKVQTVRETEITLWTGNGDGGIMSKDAALLSKVAYGYSAYQLAVRNGFEGTEKEWLDSLRGTIETEHFVDVESEQTITALKKFTVAPIMQAGMSMENTIIRDVGNPINDNDAANKSYVDSQIAIKLSVKITWSKLKALRDNSRLVAGTWYRITDYQAIISPEVAEISSQPNGPLYDILVIAVSSNELSEKARAIHHINDDGTIVLESSEIESWKVWYCIDNDTNRFSWAYGLGKGIVYRLIDEFNNDCPYDFKEILFKRYKITGCNNCPTLIGKYASREDSKYVIDKSQYIWAYTFTYLNTDGKVLDHSIVGSTMPNNEGKYTGVYNNKILPISSYLGIYPDNSTQFQYCLNNICFISDGVISKSLSYGCYSNTFGSNCYSMTFGTSCHSNTFGENCYENVFGNSIKYQSVGKYCHNNIFGDGHNHNELGNACSGNTFGTNYVYNTIGYNCYNNVFGNNYSHNSFGNSNYGFKLGNNLQSNVFLNYCSNIVFGSDSSATEKYSYYKNNFFGNNCKYILFKETEASTSYIQNYSFSQGLQGTSSAYLTIDGERSRSYETKAAKNSNGELKVYCEADLIL